MSLEGLVYVGGPRDAIVEKGAGLACPRDPLTFLDGTAQLRLTIPLVVTDGPVASFRGLSRAMSPDTQPLPAALTVLGTRLQRGGGCNFRICPGKPEGVRWHPISPQHGRSN